jgi:hypothetical protein
VGYFVEMVVNDFTQVNKHVLLDLNLGIFVNLNSGGVDNTQIANEILSVLANYHQL